jgi:hypothetical protein
MKQLMSVAFLAMAALLAHSQDSQAHGGLFRRCNGGCDTGCAAPCAPAAPVEVKYEERKVKVAKVVMKEKEIEVLECRHVWRDEKFTYTVCVPVTKEEKRKVIVCTPAYREEDYTYTVMVPHTEQRKVKCVTYQCIRENIVEKVPVCRTVCVTYVDECGRCCTKRERVTCIEERTRCVIKRIPIETEQVVNVTVCTPEVRKGKRTVCEMVRSEKEITVNVCHLVPEKRDGVRKVCETVTEKVKRKVNYCETVWEERTVRVAVCPTTCCSSPCDSGCGHHGLFRRGY